MWIYAYGSFVRGEVEPDSDIDLIGVSSPGGDFAYPDFVQHYTTYELAAIFESGDLFAHHLNSESRLLYSVDESDIIKELGPPARYVNWRKDLDSFVEVAKFSTEALFASPTAVFENGVLYMALRDMAMIYSYQQMGQANFSKYVPYQIDYPLSMGRASYDAMRKCRLASTRGLLRLDTLGALDVSELESAVNWINEISNWSRNYATTN